MNTLTKLGFVIKLTFGSKLNTYLDQFEFWEQIDFWDQVNIEIKLTFRIKSSIWIKFLGSFWLLESNWLLKSKLQGFFLTISKIFCKLHYHNSQKTLQMSIIVARKWVEEKLYQCQHLNGEELCWLALLSSINKQNNSGW